MTTDLILDLYKTTAYQKLNSYYGQSTVFSVLDIERSENRHSAFIAWLVNPASSHGFKEIPLRKLLALIAAKADNQDKCYYPEVRERLITGNYSLQVESIKTEQSIIGLANGQTSPFQDVVEKDSKGSFRKDGNNRFDIWMLLHIKFTDRDDKERQWSLPIILENKIYSTEGGLRDKPSAQTARYKRAVNILKTMVCPNPAYSQPLLVYLTPSGKPGPSDEAFVHITYQDLLDHVIQPCSILSHEQAISTDARILIDGYIRNLSRPSNNDGKNLTDYSILAIAGTENEGLESLFGSEAFQAALWAVYPKEAERLLGRKLDLEETDYDILEDFWNANEDLFKIVLYNHVKNNEKLLKKAHRIIKVSNRDNTRYFVGLQQGSWLNTGGKPASKSEASFLIFKAFCLKSPSVLSIEDLRSSFDCSLNDYYQNRFLKYLFYDFSQDVTVDVETHALYGSIIVPESDSWDFYWDKEHQLPNVKGEVRSVKMWHKEDFDKLMKKAQEYGIVVEPAD